METALCSVHPSVSSDGLIPFTRMFEAQVLKTPHSSAVEFEGRIATYEQLNARSNQLAHFLVQLNLPREARIGICLDRSIAAIECMLGVLKAGLAFVPLDPEFPKDRLGYIVEHAGIQFIFADCTYADLFTPSADLTLVNPNAIGLEASSENLDLDIQANDLAYVMYTSGSTGKPKGVQIEHGSLTTYCLADMEIYRLQSDDRTLQFSTLNFDIAIEEICPPLLVGSAVVVRPRERSTAAIELSDLIEQNSITALHIATAYWNEWVNLMASSGERVPSCLRLVIVTGEKISVEHYRRWKSLCDQELLWCNAYGPTETTVTCTAFIPDQDWDGEQMPIGRPLPGYTAYILDDELKPVDENQTGQLFIGGPALARGYLDRPDLTEKAFLNVRFENVSHPTRIYRTGDLARWLPNGEIEFAGRVDHQMKIGSYRIEPGEIEAVLNLHPGVLESLIVCEECDGQKYLIAHVVLAESGSPQGALKPVEEITQFLRERLPVYMVPRRYSFLESMPKTINGKVNREALPKGSDLVDVSSNFEDSLPQSDLERELVEVWKRVLQLPSVGIHDDFFHLGGSSLLVTRVISMITARLSVAVPVRDFFANPTIATLAAHLDHLAKRASGTGVTAESENERSKKSQALRARLPRIQSLPVSSLGARLACVHYPSLATVSRRRHAVLFAQSYGHEYTRAHRNVQQLAVRLAQNGFDAIRFDYAGTGDSDGCHDRLSIAQWTSDVKQVVDAIQVNCDIDKLSVVGVRLGANMLLESSLRNLQHCIVWDPISNGQSYLNQLRRMHAEELRSLTRYLSHRHGHSDEIMGYPWPHSFQEDIEKFTWSADESKASCMAKSLWWLESVTGATMLPRARSTAQPRMTESGRGWNYCPLSDEIYWDDLAFSNSAFASPATAQTILDILSSPE